MDIFLSIQPIAAAAKSIQSCLTLCDPKDSSPAGSSIHGILQARTLAWVALKAYTCMCICVWGLPWWLRW